MNPWLAIVGLLLLALLPAARGEGGAQRRMRGIAFLFAAIGIFLSLQLEARKNAERAAFATLHPERFAILEAPLEYDWSPRGTSYVLRASRFRANGIDFDSKIAIYARFEPREIAMEKTLRAEAFLRINEHGGYTATIKSPALLAYEGTLPWWHPASWNRALANRLEPHAGEHPVEVALAHALVLGRGERLDQSLRDSFRRGGTYHLLVFSGLQITFAAAVLAALLRWLHRPRASDWLLLAFAALAPLFIGPTASVSRASAGIALYALSRIARRPTSLENLWCVAALARLLAEPRDLFDASFHLTYAGAGALLFIGKHFGARRRWMGAVAGAEIAIAPLTLFHFHQFALGGSLLTVVMAPLIFAMLGVSALAFAVPCDALFATIGAIHRLCALLNMAGVSGYFTAPPPASLAIGFGAALIAIALLRARRRAFAVVLALLIPTGTAIARYVSLRSVHHPRVTFLDIGQGDAIAIRSRDRTILVDGGPEGPLLPLLVDRGIRRIDAAILTHAHPDHCAGLADAIEHLEVGALWVSPRRFRGDCATRLLEACRISHTPIRLVRGGETLALPDVAVHAHVAGYTFRQAPENNSSVILRVDAGMRKILLTGDIEAAAEYHFLDRDLRADVLKVAHHGSRSSSRPPFLDAVAPRVAVISCGRRNLFGHPHPSVLQALRERRVRVCRTDHSGSIDVEVRGRALYVRSRKD
ncbi:MAG TPA: DNA internalization-related competence protein ComEC/Rec2 [Thermoanaerobaculia bacterium]|nr:DNA internalization-related competence protein ComEC/Rec2 [Thermoanaerobaculia bacterium]